MKTLPYFQKRFCWMFLYSKMNEYYTDVENANTNKIVFNRFIWIFWKHVCIWNLILCFLFSITLFFDISDKKIPLVNKTFEHCYYRYLIESLIYLGGVWCQFQVCEIVLSCRKTTMEPASTSDDTRETVRILIAANPNNIKEFF